MSQNQKSELLRNAAYEVISALGSELITEQDDAGKKMNPRVGRTPKHPIAYDYLRARLDTHNFTLMNITSEVGRVIELGTAITVCRELSVVGLSERVSRLRSIDYGTARAAEFEIIGAARIAVALSDDTVELVVESEERTPDIRAITNDIAFECKQIVSIRGDDKKNADTWGILRRKSGKVFDSMSLAGTVLELITDATPSPADLAKLEELLKQFKQSGGLEISHGTASSGTYIRISTFKVASNSSGLHIPEKSLNLSKALKEYDGGFAEFTMQARRTTKAVESTDHRSRVWAMTTRKPMDIPLWVMTSANSAKGQTAGYTYQIVMSKVDWPANSRSRNLDEKAGLLLDAGTKTLDKYKTLNAMVLVTEQEPDESKSDWRNWLVVSRNPEAKVVHVLSEIITGPSNVFHAQHLLDLSGARPSHGGRKGPCWCGSGKKLKNCCRL